ncbi:hypothetical protein IQA89_08175 [Leptospira borgpetersenii serovar Balcanica]|nr:hypothetical protein [Leptospira borgpetersenii serovar Balcanica]
MIYGFSNGFYRWNTLVGVPTRGFGTSSKFRAGMFKSNPIRLSGTIFIIRL